MVDNIPDTIGIEFEATVATVEEVQSMVNSDPVLRAIVRSVVRDASIESSAVDISPAVRLFVGDRRVRVYAMDKYPGRVTGYELVTRPLSLEDTCLGIRKILAMQVKHGEVFSPRASIHIHTGFPMGLSLQKSALAAGLFAEPLLYKIAGMGRKYRGEINRSAYARPLIKPPAIKIESGRYAVLHPEKALSARSNQEFWACFGINDHDRGRYTPLRYFGVNLFSTLLRGTLEFRHFNFCVDSPSVEAVVALCQLIAQLAVRAEHTVFDSISRPSLDTSNTDDEYRRQLYAIMDLGKRFGVRTLCRDDMKAVERLIETTPQPKFAPGITRTHLRDYTMSLTVARAYGLTVVKEDETVDPGITDVHNFMNEDHRLE